MAKMGRPRIEIDQKQFDSLCGLLCTEEEIANFFCCSIDTLNNWCKRTYGMTFSEIYKIKSVYGKLSLRRYQFRLAEKHPAMAIFLGKNYLGQKDSVEYEDKESLARLDAILAGMKDEAKSETN